MPTKAVSLKVLESTIAKLHQDRQAHLKAIEEIDAVFAKLGSVPQARKPVGRPAGKTGLTRRRRRRHFKTSGSASILAFVKKAGPTGAKSGDIVKHWKSEGRSGDGYTQLGMLVKARKLKKHVVKGEKGSRYTAW